MNKENSNVFRVGQRVMRIGWRRGYPFLRLAIVTKTTKTTYYINDEKRRPERNWFATVDEAIEDDYLVSFRYCDNSTLAKIFHNHSPEWRVEDSVRCICRLRRLERRLSPKFRS